METIHTLLIVGFWVMIVGFWTCIVLTIADSVLTVHRRNAARSS
jgi:hypothetical protein